MVGEIMATVLSSGFIFVLLIVLVFIFMAFKMVNEFERVVVFRLGRLSGVKGPGLFVIIPFIDKAIKIDMRVITIDVPKQAVITRDNVTVAVDAVVYYKVLDPAAAITEVEDYRFATATLAQTTLRDVLGQMELDELLSKRDEINKSIQEILDILTDPWGIKVTAVTIRDVALPDNMKRAIAKQAEAEREKRARIILAEGEYQAAEKMKDAAKLYEGNPAGLKLREFQNLADISREKNLIVVTQSSKIEAGDVIALSKGANR